MEQFERRFSPSLNGTKIEAQGREVNATLLMRNHAPWLANIKYLYYNPGVAKTHASSPTPTSPLASANTISFRGWPDLQLRCEECWLWGQKYGRIDGDFAIKGNTLTLANGLIDTGFARLKANGEWVNAPGNERTSLKGSLHGSNLDTAAGFFGISTPIQNASFNVDYDLHWRNPPRNLRKPRSTGFYVRVWVKASLLISVAVMPDSYCGCSVLMRCCVSCGLTSEIPLARASISTLFIVPRGLKMASCILTIRWWMGWKRILQ